MVARPLSPQRRFVAGVTMIEVLVTMVIIAFGLLGMAGLQVRLQMSEMESYQRSQALMLLNDMANRITTNRNSAASYVTTAANPLGGVLACPTAVATVADRDLKEWCEALQGAGETTSSGGVVSKIGTLVGGRGCVELVGSDYLVTVVWQGNTPIAAPPASVACGVNSYNGAAGTPCANDLCRRPVTTLVRIATL